MMARFPRTDAEIVALAEAVESGLAADAAIYPATAVKDDALEDLAEAM